MYVIPSVIDPDKGREDKKIYEMMHHLKVEVMKDGGKSFIFAAADRIEREKCRKILECLFCDTEIEIVCRVPGNQNRERMDKGDKRLTDSTVMIRAGSETYAGLLKKVKDRVDIGKIGVDIKRIRKIGKEDLIFTVSGGRE